MVNWNKPNAPIHPIIECIDSSEIWTPITDRIAEGVYPWYYISSYGRVFNIHSGRYLKSAIDSKGYLYYNLKGYNGQRNYRTHRMLMLAFNYFEGCEIYDINHKDRNTTNCSLDNLEWCTKSENILHAYRGQFNNRQGEDRVNSKHTNQQAREACERIASGESMMDIANDMGVSVDFIYSISTGKAWKSISKDYDFSNKHHPNNR